REAAERGDQQGLRGGTSGGCPLRVVADQQEAQDRRDLPEDVQQDHVVGDDQSEHHAGERDELGGEQVEELLVVVEVAGAVDEKQVAHTERDEGDQRGQGVHLQVERQAECALPGDGLGVYLVEIGGHALGTGFGNGGEH